MWIKLKKFCFTMQFIVSAHSTKIQLVGIDWNCINVLVLMFDFYYGHFAGTRYKRALAGGDARSNG
ncbi:hypothetical protein A9996_16020 [Gelidibacter algens]|nr:hypothetical protein A9996_16020 [Gelidibacter algens]